MTRILTIEDVLLFLEELRLDETRRHTLNGGGDLLREAVNEGLAEWGSFGEFTARMMELKRGWSCRLASCIVRPVGRRPSERLRVSPDDRGSTRGPSDRGTALTASPAGMRRSTGGTRLVVGAGRTPRRRQPVSTKALARRCRRLLRVGRERAEVRTGGDRRRIRKRSRVEGTFETSEGGRADPAELPGAVRVSRLDPLSPRTRARHGSKPR